jgi:hypothetical protein
MSSKKREQQERRKSMLSDLAAAHFRKPNRSTGAFAMNDGGFYGHAL